MVNSSRSTGSSFWTISMSRRTLAGVSPWQAEDIAGVGHHARPLPGLRQTGLRRETGIAPNEKHVVYSDDHLSVLLSMCLAIELLKLLALFLRGMSRKWSGGSFSQKSYGVMAHCLDSNFGDHIRAARRSTRLGVNDVQAIGGRHEYEGNLELWSQSLCAFSTKRKCGHM